MHTPLCVCVCIHEGVPAQLSESRINVKLANYLDIRLRHLIHLMVIKFVPFCGARVAAICSICKFKCECFSLTVKLYANIMDQSDKVTCHMKYA